MLAYPLKNNGLKGLRVLISPFGYQRYVCKKFQLGEPPEI